MEIVKYDSLLQIEKNFNEIINNNRIKSIDYENKLKITIDKIERRRLRGLSITLKTNTNIFERKVQQELAFKIWDRLNDLEKYKVDGFLPLKYHEEIKSLYLLLARQGRLNVRYLKLPKAWIAIGIYAGILEELIVILRTPNQIGMGNKHLHTINEVIDGIKNIRNKEIKEGNDEVRFLFLTRLIENPFDDIKNWDV